MKVSAARQNDFSVLPRPKNDRADVLLTLINNGNASIEDFPKLSGFRTRISELHVKYGLELIYQPVKGTNRHGNTITYRRHILPETETRPLILIMTFKDGTQFVPAGSDIEIEGATDWQWIDK